jgi:hypothetical protein
MRLSVLKVAAMVNENQNKLRRVKKKSKPKISTKKNWHISEDYVLTYIDIVEDDNYLGERECPRSIFQNKDRYSVDLY